MRNARALVVAGLVLAAPSAGPAATLDDVVRDLEGTYSRMIDLRAEFTQTAFNKSLNQTIPAQGTVYLKKGGKLRWEYQEPTPQEIVSDGKKLWVYTPALNQVNVGDAPEALAGPAGSFLAGLGRLRAEFSVRFLNPARPQDTDVHWVLDITPNQPQPTLARLVLVLDASSREIRQSVVKDKFDYMVTSRSTNYVII